MSLRKLLLILVKNFISFNFNKKGKKRALVSFIVHPFLTRSKKHPNAIELEIIVETLIAQGFWVTVVDYRRKRITGNYDLAIGFGDALESAINNNKSKYNILYTTGCSANFQDAASVKAYLRFVSLYKTRLKNPSKYLRVTSGLKPSQFLNSDAILSIGNDFVSSTFATNTKIFNVPSLYYDLEWDVNEIIENRDYSVARSNFLWFGGKGVIHKGLDLLIKSFNGLDANLYIAGPVEKEIEIFKDYIDELENVNYLGFLDINSLEFERLVSQCCFVILPSSSEAMATSVVTLVANAGLIPIVSRSCGFDIAKSIIEIQFLSLESLNKSINFALSLSNQELKEMASHVSNDFKIRHDKERYRCGLELALDSVYNDFTLK